MSPIVRYTRFVKIGKHSLWVLIAAVVGLVVWIASDNTGEGEARLVFTNVQKTGTLEDVMIKPRYQGIDARGRPFTVIADKGTQQDKDTVVLEAVRADMMMNEGKSKAQEKWIALNAKGGVLNMKSKHLTLTGGVELFSDGGYEFRSDHAQVDIAKGTAYGDAPVEGQGPMGTLTANSFSIAERGQVIRFNGSVRMKIYR